MQVGGQGLPGQSQHAQVGHGNMRDVCQEKRKTQLDTFMQNDYPVLFEKMATPPTRSQPPPGAQGDETVADGTRANLDWQDRSGVDSEVPLELMLSQGYEGGLSAFLQWSWCASRSDNSNAVTALDLSLTAQFQ